MSRRKPAPDVVGAGSGSPIKDMRTYRPAASRVGKSAEVGGSMQLAGKDPRLAGASPEHSGSIAERRQLTMMFVDVVGSTQLNERLDPEESLDVLRTYCGICDAQIRRFGGQVARIYGDGVLAFFGVPQAHEN